MPAQFAFLFPGQGSQYVGIGQDLYAAYPIVKQTYAEASDALNYDIAALSFNDPQGEIDLTRFTQPVLLTHSTACRRVFEQLCTADVQPQVAVGHSLGEYSALVCAGSLQFAQALKLVQKRGELMGTLGEGEMQALMLALPAALELAQQHYCGIAACNLPEQNVVGGRAEDLDALVHSMQEQFPGKRSTRLKTEGAFHTYYMVPAARAFRQILDATEFQPPRIPVLSNFTGRAHDGQAEAIRSRLFLQLFNPVLWHKNLLSAQQNGIDAYIEFGGGLGKGDTAAQKRPNLEGLVKKALRDTDKPPAYHAVINQRTLEATLAALHN